MTAREVPLERNWKHWKEKYEMEQEAHIATRRERDHQISLWMQHAITLGRAIDILVKS